MGIDLQHINSEIRAAFDTARQVVEEKAPRTLTYKDFLAAEKDLERALERGFFTGRDTGTSDHHVPLKFLLLGKQWKGFTLTLSKLACDSFQAQHEDDHTSLRSYGRYARYLIMKAHALNANEQAKNALGTLRSIPKITNRSLKNDFFYADFLAAKAVGYLLEDDTLQAQREARSVMTLLTEAHLRDWPYSSPETLSRKKGTVSLNIDFKHHTAYIAHQVLSQKYETKPTINYRFSLSNP